MVGTVVRKTLKKYKIQLGYDRIYIFAFMNDAYHHNPEIAIIDANTLSSIGLRSLLEKMMPLAIIRTFSEFSEFIRDTPDSYFHYFISAQILIEHNVFFIERKQKTIVLTNGLITLPQQSNFHILNIYQSEENMVRSLLRLQQSAHAHGKNLPLNMRQQGNENKKKWTEPNGLTKRELEVLLQLVRGMTNKEIAERLNIGLTTVISHRKKITEKLNIRSLSGLAIYAVMNGYIEADQI